ncbi:MAG: TRAP transporter large permease subunit [Pseudomonadota bacterium]|nr:TRAP transporter large permease subunit [Pseudomonadota bacterium]
MNIQPLWVIAAMILVYVLLGMVMELFAILTITVPIDSGLILDLGFDLIWWGIIVLVVLEIGLVSPPIGMNVFVLHSLVGKEVPLTTIYKGVMPFVSADLIRLALLILLPSLVLWLPSKMF